MRNVKSIEFVFENCECLEIEAKYFGGVHLEDIRTSIARIACNSIAKMQTVHSAVFEIFSEANVEYAPFGNQSDKMVKFDRLAAWDDITQIVVHYEDNQEEVYYVDYDDDGNDGLGAPNKNQKSCISALGNLYLVIEKDKTIGDYFDEDEMDNPHRPTGGFYAVDGGGMLRGCGAHRPQWVCGGICRGQWVVSPPNGGEYDSIRPH